VRSALARAACAAAALGLGCVLVPAGPAAAAQPPHCQSAQLQPVRGSARQPTGLVPVVFIHGITSSPQIWQPDSAGSIAGQAARMAGVTAWTFSYQKESLDWVTDPAIGPAFAQAISCLAAASGHQVIVVAHSMGGLATQYALGYPRTPAAGTVAELITIGTPFNGSALLSAIQYLTRGPGAAAGAVLAPRELVLTEALLSACAGLSQLDTSNPCGFVSVARTQLGTDLEENSPEINALPPWPAQLPVYNIAGDLRLRIPLGLFTITANFGDVPVSLPSATAHNTVGTPYIKTCSPLTLLGLVDLDPGPCFHTHLPHDADIITTVLNAIRAQLPTPYDSFVGRFYSHDYELCVGQALDLTAATAASNPPCSGNGTSGWERLWGCGYASGGCGFAWIALQFAYQADGTVTATSTSAPIPVPSPAGGSFYDDALTVCTLNGTGKIVPCNASVTGIPPEGLTPGSEQLSLVGGGVLKVTLPQGYWGGTSSDVCGQSASQADDQQYCPNG
jgi:pimeloyl-ACP methyl ester carboxylesterase